MNDYRTNNTYQPPTSYQAPGSPAPHGGRLTSDERNLGTIAHVTPLVLMVLSTGLAGFLGSLIVYFYAKDKGPAARRYAAGALNVQIVISLLSAAAWIFTFGLLVPVVVIVGMVIHVIGAMRAHNGEVFNPPMTPRFVS
ncbi:MAG: DUF4870 domain-containing protein [Actinomycetia bacterium]|nr:DUF4870 domain-containing protein [Actinomycetes bacterium]